MFYACCLGFYASLCFLVNSIVLFAQPQPLFLSILKRVGSFGRRRSNSAKRGVRCRDSPTEAVHKHTHIIPNALPATITHLICVSLPLAKRPPIGDISAPARRPARICANRYRRAVAPLNVQGFKRLNYSTIIIPCLNMSKAKRRTWPWGRSLYYPLLLAAPHLLGSCI